MIVFHIIQSGNIHLYHMLLKKTIIKYTLFWNLWIKKNYITLLDDEEYAFVVHPQKLPDREQLMHDFMCFGSDTEN